MARGKAATKIGPFTQTTLVQYGTFKESFTPNWDETPGNMQPLPRVKLREEMGQKKTPIGPGTLRPARR